MKPGNDYLWPYRPSSPAPADQIDWISVPPEVLANVRPATIRRVKREFLVALHRRFEHLWDSMSDESKEAALAIVEGRPENKEGGKKGACSPKEKAKRELEALKGEAEAQGDLTTQLKIIEIEAKLEALLTQKQEVEDSSLASRMLAARKRIHGL